MFPKSDNIKTVTNTAKTDTSRISQGGGFIALIIPNRVIPTVVKCESVTLNIYVTAILNVDGHVHFHSLTVYEYDTRNVRSFKSTQ